MKAYNEVQPEAAKADFVVLSQSRAELHID